MAVLRGLLLFSLSLHFIPTLTSASCLGCVDLDDITFYKLIPRYPYALIKFDIAFPYGEKHEEFGQFSIKAHQATNDLLVGLVGIKDYGEKENSALAAKFNVDPESYPGIYLFRGHGLNDYVKFPPTSAVTVDNLKEFVTQNSDLFIGLEGCLKEFNEFVVGYVDKSEGEQNELIAHATSALDKLTDDSERTSAKVYLAIMNKVVAKGSGFVKEETTRLTKLKNGKISDSKRSELTHKLNILKSFKSKNSGLKSEL